MVTGAQRIALAFAALACTLVGVGCGARPGAGLAVGAPAALPTSTRSHVAVVVMENQELSAVIGRHEAPYVNALARRYALATNYYAIAHPSLPNYLAMIGGSTFGVHSDCTDCSVSATNLVDQLEQSRVSWRAYMEGLPSACDTAADSGGYAKKHDPFLYFRDVVSSRARCSQVVPYASLSNDLRSGRLADFVWLTPNLCDDGHDCSLGQADRYLASVVPALLRELGPSGVLILTWDEGTSDRSCCGGQAAGGRVATIVAGPGARAATVSATPYDHYSLLRTVEDLLGLSHLGRAADPHTRSLDALLARPGRLL